MDIIKHIISLIVSSAYNIAEFVRMRKTHLRIQDCYEFTMRRDK